MSAQAEDNADHLYRPTWDNDMNLLCIKPSKYGGWTWCYLPKEQHPDTLATNRCARDWRAEGKQL